MIRSLLIVFVGGGLGSVVRFGLGRWINSFYTDQFPLGTLLANVIACFVLGLAIGLADHRQMFSTNTRLFLTVGFCGGFSTFSTFSAETLTLIQTGQPTQALLYTLISVVVCLSATFGGLYLGQHL